MYRWSVAIKTKNVNSEFDIKVQMDVLHAVKKSFKIMKKGDTITITKGNNNKDNFYDTKRLSKKGCK